MFTPTLLAVLFLALFLLGLGVGYVYSKDSDDSTAEKVRTAIAIVITAVWVVAMIADIFITGYAISTMVHALMGAIVGYFFAENGFNITFGE